MRKAMKAALVMAVGLAGAAALVWGSVTIEARPQYVKAFTTTYPDVKEGATAKCTLCHPAAGAKSVRNDYGKAVGSGLGGKNLKLDDAKLVEALRSAEASPSAIPGKSYGDLLKDGALPTKTE